MQLFLKKSPYLLALIFLVLQPTDFSLASETNTQRQDHTPSPFTLGAGDVLKIYVWNHKSLSFKSRLIPMAK